jgi:hypothetical protein
MLYNTTTKQFQYCDGSDWIAMTGPGSGSGGCTNPSGTEGEPLYNTTNRVMQGCAGNIWRAMGPEKYVPNAVQFDGTNDYLTHTFAAQNETSLSGSFWIRLNSLPAVRRLVENESSTFFIQTDGRLTFYWVDSSGNIVANCYSTAGADIGDGDWHHVNYSFDGTGTNNYYVYIDGIDRTDGATCFAGAFDTFYLNNSNDLFLGRDTGGTGYTDGDIADFWMDFGTYIDLSVPANRAKFYNNGPVYLGADGSKPTGVAPEVFLSGDTADWHTNKGTGGGFTENGALSDAPLDPGGIIVPPSDGLIGHWPLDESAGTAAADATGNGNTGTLNSFPASPWLPAGGQIAGALQFDNNDSYVAVANESNFDFERTDPFSISTWIYRDSNTAGDEIISKYTTPGLEYRGYGIWLVAGETSLNFSLENSASNKILVETNSGAVSSGTWHHIAVTYDGSSNTSGVEIYVDGVDQSLIVSANNLSSTTLNNSSVVIGGDSADLNCCVFNGRIDDTRIYDRELSPAEVQQLYLATSPGGGSCTNPAGPEGAMIYNGAGGDVTTGLAGQWKLDESAGTTAADSSGNGNDGTLLNFPASPWLPAGGQVDGALEFDGNNDWVSIPGDSVFDLWSGQQHTWSVWVNNTSFKENAYAWSQDDAGTAPEFFITPHTTSSSTWGPVTAGVTAGLNNGSSSRLVVHTTNNVLTLGNWHHVLVTYDGTLTPSSRMRIYVDGVDRTDTGDVLSVGSVPNVAGADIRIGWGGWSGTEYDGKIDDMRFYDRLLDAQEIEDLYNFGANPAGGIMQYCNGADWIAIGKAP